MSLTNALTTSFAGMRNTESRISVTSTNVTNVDKTGYTKKEYVVDYSVSAHGSVPTNGSIQSVYVDSYLYDFLISESSTATYDTIIAEYSERYVNTLGYTDGESSLSASVDGLNSAFDMLSVTPEDSSLKLDVVNEANSLANSIRSQSNTIQTLRQEIDQEIELVVDQINTYLGTLDLMNTEIGRVAATGVSAADLEDERRNALEELSKLINVNFYINDNNQMTVYTSNGTQLLGSEPYPVTYEAAGTVGAGVVYPGGFDNIEVNGVDITTNIRSGELGAFLYLRDTQFVEEQEALDELSSVLMRELNALMNEGAPIPPRTEITSDEIGLTAATTVANAPNSATGDFRIAITDTSGTVINFADFDLSTFATLGDLITAVNAALGPDITASISTPDGELQFVSNVADQGISFNEMDSSIGADNEGFSAFFGLNNLFKGTSAEDIAVSDYLLERPEYIATSRLDDSVGLVAGDAGIAVGNGSLSSEMNAVFTTGYAFSAAGDFAAQTETLDRYADKIVANAANEASLAQDSASASSIALEQTKITMDNISAVNVDEELIELIDLEGKYEASATIISTIRDLFDTLIGAVR